MLESGSFQRRRIEAVVLFRSVSKSAPIAERAAAERTSSSRLRMKLFSPPGKMNISGYIRRLARLAAAISRTYPRRLIALSTFSTVCRRTPGRLFNTRSTVARLTPASLAMSCTVGRIDFPQRPHYITF
jgi:MoxR-like ATPase